MQWAARNLMTLSTIAMAVAAGIAAAGDAIPPKYAAMFATVTVAATAVARAAVVVAEHLRKTDAPVVQNFYTSGREHDPDDPEPWAPYEDQPDGEMPEPPSTARCTLVEPGKAGA